MSVVGRSRRGRGGASTPRGQLVAAAGLAALVVLAAVVAFGKQSLLSSGYELHAVFANANQLKGGSAVRVAGLDIGRVTSVEGTDDGKARVTMKIDADAPPLYRDAQLQIEPRLAFEGNFYVRVDPGSPANAPLRDGATIAERQTARPVQADQVLDTLSFDARESMKDIIAELGGGFGAGPGTGVAATGAAGLRTAVRELDLTLRSVERSARAMQGTEPGDLSRAISGTGDLADALADRPDVLRSVIRRYARTVRAFADEHEDLAATIASGDRLLASAPRSLSRIERMLPDIEAFARALRPTVDALKPSLPVINGALAQIAAFGRPTELPSLVAKLEGPVRDLPPLEEQLGFALPLIAPVGRCLERNIVPALKLRVHDGDLTVEQPAWLEGAHMMANLTAASSGLDANGATIRAGVSVGDQTLSGLVPGLGEVVATATQGAGVRPIWLGPNGKHPEWRPDVRCDTQPRLRRIDSRTGRLLSTLARSRTPDAKALQAQEQQDARAVLRDLAATTASGTARDARSAATRTTRPKAAAPRDAARSIAKLVGSITDRKERRR